MADQLGDFHLLGIAMKPLENYGDSLGRWQFAAVAEIKSDKTEC